MTQMGELSTIEQLSDIDTLSHNPNILGVLLFKHSSRCGISTIVLRNFLKEWQTLQPNMNYFYVDILKNRDISNEIAKKYQVMHQSPQILFIKNGECVGNESHYMASLENALSWVNE